MSDRIWPGLPSGPNEHETRQEVERHDVDSLQTELNEQERIGNTQRSPFNHNRGQTPGVGVGGRVRINSDHWGE